MLGSDLGRMRGQCSQHLYGVCKKGRGLLRHHCGLGPVRHGHDYGYESVLQQLGEVEIPLHFLGDRSGHLNVQGPDPARTSAATFPHPCSAMKK